MFRWNHIAAVIMSTAMLFSMMPMGVTAAEPAGAETGVQPEQLETGIADAGAVQARDVVGGDGGDRRPLRRHLTLQIGDASEL